MSECEVAVAMASVSCCYRGGEYPGRRFPKQMLQKNSRFVWYMGRCRSGGVSFPITSLAISEVLRCSFISHAHSEKLHGENFTAGSWMICAHNNALRNDFEHRPATSGVFLLHAASSLPAWDSAVAEACPSDPPISAARHFFSDLHPSVPAKGLFPSKRNAPRAPDPTRTRSIRESGMRKV